MSIRRRPKYDATYYTFVKTTVEVIIDGRSWIFDCIPTKRKTRILWSIHVVYLTESGHRIARGTRHIRGPLSYALWERIAMTTEIS